jgi:hypothetical protein
MPRARAAFGESGKQPEVFSAVQSYEAVTIGGASRA